MWWDSADSHPKCTVRAKMWVPGYPPQQRHFQLLKAFRSTGEQHLTAAPVNKNISTEETWSWTPDFRKEKILHPKKEKLQFCSCLSCMSKHLGKQRWWNLIVQIITDPTEKQTRSSFTDSRNVTWSPFGSNLCSFILCNKNMQIGHTDSKRVQETGPMCIWSFSSALYVIQ